MIGDLVVLETGCSVPADVRLTETQEFQSREMALTGESEPVNKKAEYVQPLEDEKEEKKGGKQDEKKLTAANIAFMGCDVSSGRGKGFVVKIGMQTNMGSIADTLNKADSGPSPLQQRLEHLGHQLGIGAIFLCTIVFVVGLYFGNTGGTHPYDAHSLITAVLLIRVLNP